jgi:glycosyltransferase involved in cell wall biosynthesis
MGCGAARLRVLYLSYTGLMEPLGQSQVLAYLRHLSESCTITLVTFEKAADLERKGDRDELARTCEAFGIRWLPRRYHRRPRIPATAWDVATLLWDITRLTATEGTDLVHCRSYVPAMAAWLAGKATGVPFLFDMRALWPEEMVEAGTLRRGSLTYKALLRMERHLITDAGTVVSLTQAAVRHLRSTYPESAGQRYIVIPTCVDLDRFAPRQSVPSSFTVGSLGTIVSGWYHLDWLFRLVREARTVVPGVRLKIVTRDDPDRVREAARRNGIDPSDMVLDRAAPGEVAQKVADMSFGALFFTAGISKLGSAPTRLGEFLACGIPVMGNRGVGDMAEIIETHRVGVVVEDGSPLSLANGIAAMREMLADPELASRCRAVAEEHFSVERGAKAYRHAYAEAGNARAGRSWRAMQHEASTGWEREPAP